MDPLQPERHVRRPRVGDVDALHLRRRQDFAEPFDIVFGETLGYGLVYFGFSLVE